MTTGEAVKEFEKQYPTLAKRFRDLQEEQYETFAGKMLSYGTSNIAAGTTLETEQDRRFSLTGLWFRMNDKINRLKQMVVLNQDNPVGESADDAYQDLSVYSVICQLVAGGFWKRG